MDIKHAPNSVGSIQKYGYLWHLKDKHFWRHISQFGSSGLYPMHNAFLYAL